MPGCRERPPAGEADKIDTPDISGGFSGSRTQLGQDGFRIFWAQGDDLSVWYQSSAGTLVSNMHYTLAARSAGTGEGIFYTKNPWRWDPAAEEHRFYALYPYRDDRGSDVHSARLGVKTVQVQHTATENIGENDFMVGLSRYYGSEPPEHLEIAFFHPLTALEFILDASGTPLEGEVLHSISLRSSIPFAGEMTYDFDAEQFWGYTATEVTLGFEAPLILNGEVRGWMVVMPEDFTGVGFEVILTTDRYTATIPMTPVVAFQAQTKYRVPLTLAESGMNLVDNEDNGTDLAEQGVANCYVVPQAGSYHFPARKPDGGEGELIGGGIGATWVWMTGEEPTLLDPASIVYDSHLGIIRFTVDEYTPGNALIGLIDRDGTLAWSWHLWFTDPLPEAAASGTPMDRNLGATSSDRTVTTGQTVGFYYQWGRKEPFVGPSANYSALPSEQIPFQSLTQAYVLNKEFFGSSFGWEVIYDDRIFEGDHEEAAEYPLAMIYHPDYMPSADDPRWIVKADPCPAGWRVPTADELISLFGISPVFGVVTWSPFYYGFEVPGQSEWWPAGGYRNYEQQGDIFNLAAYGKFWSAEQGIADHTASHVFLTGAVSTIRVEKTTYGNSVRCIRK